MYVLDICSTLAQCGKWITKPSQKFADFSVPRIQWDPCNMAIAIVVTMVKKFFSLHTSSFSQDHTATTTPLNSIQIKINQEKSRLPQVQSLNRKMIKMKIYLFPSVSYIF